MDHRSPNRPRRECQVCGKLFKRDRVSGNRLSKSLVCSPECRRFLYANKRPWTKEEDDYIIEHANDLPFVKFYGDFKRCAGMKGWPPRTSRAFRKRVNDLGFNSEPRFVMLRISELARMLGVSREVTKRWTEEGLPVGYRNPQNGHRFVSLKEVRRFARAKPHKFAGIKYKDLLTVLDDEQLAKDILERFPKRNGVSKRVLCITTGRTYDSASAAAKHYCVVRQSITRACRAGGTCIGHRFKYID
jgi:DNA-binding transcriptional MerR regulator